MYGYVYMSTSACRCQKRALDPMELESQVTVSCLIGVLRFELRSSARASVLNPAEPSLQP